MPPDLQLLNKIHKDVDQMYNGKQYEKETSETSVVYRIENLRECKSYIGKTKSIKSKGRGAMGRFIEHWQYAHSSDAKKNTACPIFYKALRKSASEDWFVYTIKVCPHLEAKRWETHYTTKYKTGNPDFGYNFFIGNSVPDNAKYLEKYRQSKAVTNAVRAQNGSMKRTESNKKLPVNIYYHEVKKGDKTVGKGYRVEITINDTKYKKVFMALEESMKDKLISAKLYLELVKNKATGENVDNYPVLKKGPARKSAVHNNLPNNIRYITYYRKGIFVSEGYIVEIRINKKRYSRRFLDPNATMATKLKNATEWLENLKLEHTN